MPGWLRLILSGALLVGLFAWAYHLGNQGTGGSLADLQTIGNGLDVAVLTSDPAVSVATDLSVLPPSDWQLRLTLNGPPLRGEQVQRGKILIVLSGGLSLDSFIKGQLTKAGFVVRSYASKKFPWTFLPAPATTVEIPYFGTSEIGYATDLSFLIGDLPPDLVAHTSVGVDMAAPTVGQPFIDCPPNSRHSFCAVSPQNLSSLIEGTDGWHGREVHAPDQSAVLEALPTGSWSITSANPPPKSQGAAWTWSDYPEISSRTVIHFSSTGQQAGSQRDLLWSGVIFGVVGGVVTTWLTTFGSAVRRRRDEERSKRLPLPGSQHDTGKGPVGRLLVMLIIGVLIVIRRLSR